MNNPLNFVDPTGHSYEPPDRPCLICKATNWIDDNTPNILPRIGFHVTGKDEGSAPNWVYNARDFVGNVLCVGFCQFDGDGTVRTSTNSELAGEVALSLLIGGMGGIIDDGAKPFIKRSIDDVAELSWSSSKVKQAAEDLLNGSTTVYVSTKEQAEEIYLGMYHSKGYTNTTGMTSTEARRFFDTKNGTYHWDDQVDSNNSLVNHAQHGSYRHLQIHTHDGKIIRINFGERLNSN